MRQDFRFDDDHLRGVTERALRQMRAQGFDHAQVSARHSAQDEINVSHDEPSLLRSTEILKLSMLGLIDGRMASAELSDFDDAAVPARAAALFRDAKIAPRDDANAVSSDQHADLVKGPQAAALDLMALKVRELLSFRERETPLMHIDEASASHTLQRTHTLTSGGSELVCRVGWYAMTVFGTAREGQRSSSFNSAEGTSHDLSASHVSDYFGIGPILRETVRQIHTQPLGGKFVGAAVLSPSAVSDLLAWLLSQLGDTPLIAGSSLYRDRVGHNIASTCFSLRSRFDAPGITPISADAFNTPAVEIVREGILQTLTPGLYGSRKTGLPHVPIAAQGWEIAAGDTPMEELLSTVGRGALVGRLSMGAPAANGDFSGVIKNSFAIANGHVGPALAEAMIAGNVAQILQDIRGVSCERVDSGTMLLPWLKIANLHFS